MCKEDIRIGRKKFGRLVGGTATTVSAEAIGSNPNRTSITFSGFNVPAGTGTMITFSPENPAVLGQGITIPNFASGMTLDIETHGDIITKAWYVICQAGTQNFGIIESMWQDDGT